MANEFIGFKVDSSEAAALAGFLAELSISVRTDKYLGPVIKFVHAQLAYDFSEHMSVMAESYPSEFQHVYEWGENGVFDGQLWRDVLRGNGANRLATWEWLPSKVPVPVREDFAEKGVKEIHVFTWKAPTMEYVTDIEINPFRGSGIAYFSGPTNPEGKWEMKWKPGGITVQYPGGEAAHGAFTREYVAWWSGPGATESFNDHIRQALEGDFYMGVDTTLHELTTGVRARNKSLSISVPTDEAGAIEAGRRAARIFTRGYAAKAQRKALALEAALYHD